MLVFFGIIGEYVGAIYTKVQQRPYAIEQERIGFEFAPAPPSPMPDAVAQAAETVASPS
jgi:hypothetical protein